MSNLIYIKICVKNARLWTVLFLFLKIKLAIFTPITALTGGYLIDAVNRCIQENDISFALVPILILGIVFFLNFILGIVLQFVSLKLSLTLQKKLDIAFLTHIGKLKYSYFEDDKYFDTLERVGENYSAKIQTGFYNILDLIDLLIRLGGLFIIVAASSIVTAIAVLLFCIPIYYVADINGKKVYTAYEQAVPHKRFRNYLLGLLVGRSSLAERVLFNYYPQISKRFNNEYDVFINLNFQADKKSFRDSKLLAIVFTLFVIFAGGVMIKPLVQGSLSAGNYIAIIIALSNMIHTLSWQFQDMLLSYQKNKLYIKDFNKFDNLEKMENINMPPDSKILSKKFEYLEFKNIIFKYPDSEHIVLNNFSLKLLPNTQYAIVGVNGCGKTTLVKLLAGLYDDSYAGEIILNGKNIKEYSFSERKAYFSILFQDYEQFQVSAKEQIHIANQKTTIKEIEAVYNQINLLDKINSFSLKLDTPLGKIEENSENLSKGQWQRVALARAFAKNANVFVFDEPTASLDPFAENEMYKTIRNYTLEKQMSTIYITHRLAAARLADKIIVIDNGEVAEIGSHDELVAKNGLYAKMYKDQQSWYTDTEHEMSFFADNTPPDEDIYDYSDFDDE